MAGRSCLDAAQGVDVFEEVLVDSFADGGASFGDRVDVVLGGGAVRGRLADGKLPSRGQPAVVVHSLLKGALGGRCGRRTRCLRGRSPRFFPPAVPRPPRQSFLLTYQAFYMLGKLGVTEDQLPDEIFIATLVSSVSWIVASLISGRLSDASGPWTASAARSWPIPSGIWNVTGSWTEPRTTRCLPAWSTS